MAVNQSGNANTIQRAVYLTLHDHIMYLQTAPGTVMSTQEVAKRLNVSRTPVREAFIRLEREGLVEIYPQKETIVSRIDLKRVEQERFMRESLELSVQEPFLKKCSKKHLMQLWLLIEEQKEARNTDNYSKFLLLDNQFHQLIFDVAQQGFSWEIMSGALGHYNRIRLLTTWTKAISQTAVDQHEQLVEAYEKQDLERVRGIMKYHLSKLIDEEVLLMEKYPAFFKKEEEEGMRNFSM